MQKRTCQEHAGRFVRIYMVSETTRNIIIRSPSDVVKGGGGGLSFPTNNNYFIPN